MIAELLDYLQYPFVQYAIIVGVLIALCSSLLGVTLVLKRFSFIGDGLSHMAFGTMSVAAVVGLTNEMWLVLPVTIVSAIILFLSNGKAKIKGDAAVAMLSVSSLAVGYLIMNIFSDSANVSGDVCTTLFGTTLILTLTAGKVWLCVALSIITLVVFILFYNKIFACTFDEGFSQATGIKVQFYNLLTAVIIAVVIVLAMNLVGSLLISALIIFPALSSMRVFKSFKGVVISSAIISVLAALMGIIISILFSTPVGSTIVAVNLLVFIVFYLLGIIFKGKV